MSSLEASNTTKAVPDDFNVAIEQEMNKLHKEIFQNTNIGRK